MPKKPKKGSATTYLTDGKGPPLLESELKDTPEAFKIQGADLEDMGRRKKNTLWDWAVFERAYVEGIVGADDKRRWPTQRELAKWSGCSYGVINNRAARNEWASKRRVHEERIPALVEEAAARVVGERIGDYLGAADEAVARRSARNWVKAISENYLDQLLCRLEGNDPQGRPPPAANVGDAEKLLRLRLLVEGEATERVQTVGIIQANVDLQARATVMGLEEAASRGLLEEASLSQVLQIIESHVSRVSWKYKLNE